jgi:hypothetical protein
MVVAGRESGLEREAAHLWAKATDKDRENDDLQEHIMMFDVVPQETNIRLRDSLEDNVGFPRVLFTLSRLPAQGPF